jgi:RNA polymerase sigma-70 factor (ECF subfamily)
METDRRLVQRSLAGEQTAFNELYQRHLPRVYHFLRRLTGETTAAEDLTQETFLAAYQGLASWRGQSNLGAWLCGIAFRQYAVARRQIRLETEPLDEESGRFPTAPGLDPLVACLRQEQLQQIEAALLALPPLCREAFVLVKLEGLSYRETAEWLHVPLGTVQSRLWRAVCLLKKELTELVAPAADPASWSDGRSLPPEAMPAVNGAVSCRGGEGG